MLKYQLCYQTETNNTQIVSHIKRKSGTYVITISLRLLHPWEREHLDLNIFSMRNRMQSRAFWLHVYFSYKFKWASRVFNLIQSYWKTSNPLWRMWWQLHLNIIMSHHPSYNRITKEPTTQEALLMCEVILASIKTFSQSKSPSVSAL